MSMVGYKQYDIEIKGVAPMLQHNGALSSKSNPIVKAMSAITSKKKKVDADLEELANLEFKGGLYTRAGRIVVPEVMIESWLVEGAKVSREGQIALAGLFVEQGSEFNFSGPQTIEERMADPECRLVARVKVQRNAVERCRPIFHDWTLRFQVAVLGDTVSPDMLKNWVVSACRLKGLGDWRPRYGRAELVSFNESLFPVFEKAA